VRIVRVELLDRRRASCVSGSRMICRLAVLAIVVRQLRDEAGLVAVFLCFSLGSLLFAVLDVARIVVHEVVDAHKEHESDLPSCSAVARWVGRELEVSHCLGRLLRCRVERFVAKGTTEQVYIRDRRMRWASSREPEL